MKRIEYPPYKLECFKADDPNYSYCFEFNLDDDDDCEFVSIDKVAVNVLFWLRDNLGEYDTVEYLYESGGSEDFEIWIKDPKIAMQFKLVWAK